MKEPGEVFSINVPARAKVALVRIVGLLDLLEHVETGPEEKGFVTFKMSLEHWREVASSASEWARPAHPKVSGERVKNALGVVCAAVAVLRIAKGAHAHNG